jgi:hypothetical protein
MLKLLVLLTPIALLLVINIALPLNTFSFRVLEALLVYSRNSVLTGPFYPYQSISMTEEGDLGHGTPFALKRKISWTIDQFGYRKGVVPSDQKPSIVVVGDSMVAGGRLDQKETFTEVLEELTGRIVYPYAPGTLDAFLSEYRFIVDLPRVVIFEQVEREISSNRRLIPVAVSKNNANSNVTVKIAIAADRAKKGEIFRYLLSKLASHPSPLRYNGMLFLQGDEANRSIGQESIERVIETIVTYRDEIEKKGMRFIYMPVPNKETIYYDYLPNEMYPSFLREVIKGLRNRGVAIVDLVSAFEKARGDGIVPYEIDDTHWSSEGVRIAAEILKDDLAEDNLK